MILFDRSVCNRLESAESKEWLVTNGIGGYASGTVANVLTRRYHGLLIAATQPPTGRTLVATKLDETAEYNGTEYPLYTNRWEGNIIDPHGYFHIEEFHLEGTIPVWTFAVADARIEKRIWMQPGKNTTYIQYHVVHATGPVKLNIKALVNCRDHHSPTEKPYLQGKKVKGGIVIRAGDDEGCLILAPNTKFLPANEWYQNYELKVEQYRGLPFIERNLFVGTFHTSLQKNESLCFVISTEHNPNRDGNSALEERRDYESELVNLAPHLPPRFCLAADQFIVNRSSSTNSDGKTVIAGYPWFGDWGRDTMISLPGLTIATNRPEVARNMIETYSRYVSEGMLPNRFTDRGEAPEYNTVDATLWYFEAIRAYVQHTRDFSLLSSIYPVLTDIIDWHLKGTRYNIHVDKTDGLLYAGENGVQLTWMDAKVGDWVVTPRIGKPVEINALWYNALMSMIEFSDLLNKNSQKYKQQAAITKKHFTRYWNADSGCLYDVIDGPGGVDASLRPNQLFAVSLHHSPLNFDQQKAIVDLCARNLLTSHGLRSLAPGEPGYAGMYGGDVRQRDSVYHQGTVWAWLMGTFLSAHLRVYQDPITVKKLLHPLHMQMADHGLGGISEIFDGDAPFAPRGCIAQAWSIAEIIRVYCQINQSNSFDQENEN